MILQPLDTLLDPISPDAITGIDPRSDVSPSSKYYFLKDVRNSARASERNALIEEESLFSIINEWKPILDKTPDFLINDSKDLEFVAWYIEALCRFHGFNGLNYGFKLANELISLFWNDLYPMPDDGDLNDRIAPLIGLNGIESEGSLIMPIKSLYITADSSEGQFSIWEYNQALIVDRLEKEKQQNKFDSGVVPLEKIIIAFKETPTSFYIDLIDEIEQCIESFSILSATMDTAMNGEPQPTTYISKALQAALLAVQQLAEDVLAKQIINEDAEEITLEMDELIGTEQSVINQAALNSIFSRESAINNLSEIAEYFKKTEPHSPMSYAIEQVIRWSELTLPELLQELITDNDARNGFFKLSGIQKNND